MSKLRVLEEERRKPKKMPFKKREKIIGVEIISLEKLTSKDIKKLPKKIKEALKKTLEKISMKTEQIT